MEKLMNKTDYPKALEAAQIELERLVQERIELDHRIVRLKQTITGLSGLCEGNNDIASVPSGVVPMVRCLKLTSGIRQALAEAVSPMRPPELRETLMELGLNMTQYSNKLAVIHNTLSRLERQGEVSEIAGAWVLTEKGRLASRMDYIDFTSMQPAEAVPGNGHSHPAVDTHISGNSGEVQRHRHSRRSE